MGLFDDNRVAENTMLEGAQAKRPWRLRLMFAMLLVHLQPYVDAKALWQKHRKVRTFCLSTR